MVAEERPCTNYKLRDSEATMTMVSHYEIDNQQQPRSVPVIGELSQAVVENRCSTNSSGRPGTHTERLLSNGK